MSVEITRRLFTVDDYHRMAEAGILGEDDRVELIYGEIIAMSPIGPPHSGTVNRIVKLMMKLVGDNAVVHIQNPVVLDEYNEPQPDIVLLRPRQDFYTEKHPGPEDVFLILEVADSSLAYDRRVKAKLYAEMRIQEYWIADVNAKCLYAYSNPHQNAYRVLRELHGTDSITPKLLPECQIDLKDLLP